MNEPAPKISSSDEPYLRALSALVDDELSTTERAALVGRLADDPQASARVADYRAQNLALKVLFATQQEKVRYMIVPRRASWRWYAGLIAACLAAGAILALVPGWVAY